MKSRDRVHFFLRDKYDNWSVTAEAAALAFGIDERVAVRYLREGSPLIVCRPSQFARFIIIRSQGVTNNAFQQFQAKLEPAEEVSPARIDVSGNHIDYEQR